MIRYDNYEVTRFEGSEPRWFDKFKSLKWLFCTVVIVLLFLSVVSRELGSIGDLKTQTIEMIY